MAWVLGSSMRPWEQPEVEILGDGFERMVALETAAWDEYRRRDPSNPYLRLRISSRSGFHLGSLSEPIRIKITRMSAPLLDMFGIRIGKAITQRVVDAIETLEPDVHNYLPLEILMPDGSPAAEKHVLLNVCSRLDTIAIQHSENLVEIWVNREKLPGVSLYRGNGKLMGSQKRFHGATAYADKIGNHALWYEYKLGEVIISNPLAAALMTTGAIAHHGDYRDYTHPIIEI